MKRLRPPGWLTWYMLIWLSCVVMPTKQGKMRLNPLVALISWTYGVIGLDVGVTIWARQTYWVYWEPWQIVGGCLTALLFFLVGLLFGACAGQWCYQIQSPPVEMPSQAPAQEAYPPDPRRESQKILLETPKLRKTVVRPIWWRIVVNLAFSIWVGVASGERLLQAFKMPRMLLQPLEVSAERVPDWKTVTVDGGFEVEMPGQPQRQGDWLIFENVDGRFGVGTSKLGPDEATWRWQLWGGCLAQVQPLDFLQACQQANLEGIDFSSADLRTRLLVGRERLYSLCVITREGDWRGAAFLNSFRAVTH